MATPEDNKYTVVISERATEMMVRYACFLAQVSERAAEELISEFTLAARSLEDFPERNPWLLDPYSPLHKYRKLLVDKRYLLVYQIKGRTVYVDFAVDCRQDYRWLL